MTICVSESSEYGAIQVFLLTFLLTYLLFYLPFLLNCLLFYLLTYLLTYFFTYLPLLFYSLTDWLTDSLTHSFTHSLTHLLTYLLTYLQLWKLIRVYTEANKKSFPLRAEEDCIFVIYEWTNSAWLKVVGKRGQSGVGYVFGVIREREGKKERL